ncbi:MAG TPA: aldo/keto reductase [Oligoflexus sp.]|uniref:aldo/keto reductase n=1 Tax=Oligoflexus sp. TaxID=1971216 RepID=UPI002D6C195D|nr:aldo/keto reductase [Oligoflexus sp.]HYX35005.1 aldo/keto reductase [Oligoflexus sp.]
MKSRALGRTDIQIAPIVFGGNVFGWTIDESRSFEILDAFVAGGFHCIDTADVYSSWVPGNKGGESESILGRWMKARGNRKKIVLATKLGSPMGPDRKGLKKSYMMDAVEASLRRLQTDYIDLYQAHQDDRETPLDETLAAFDALIQQGKVRAIGASNYEADRLSAALNVSQSKGLHRYETLQPEYNLYDRAHFEGGLEKCCLDQGVGVIPYFSLASGFLSGKYRSASDLNKSPRGQGIQRKYLNERGFRILQALDEVAQELKANPTQVSLAWLLHRPSITAPIVSATTLEQLQDLMRAPQLELSKEILDRLNIASRVD